VVPQNSDLWEAWAVIYVPVLVCVYVTVYYNHQFTKFDISTCTVPRKPTYSVGWGNQVTPAPQALISMMHIQGMMTRALARQLQLEARQLLTLSLEFYRVSILSSDSHVEASSG
jgi:hypothetical protein